MDRALWHKLIDVVAGRQAALSPDDVDALHEDLEPGSTTPPPSDAEIAAAQEILARQAASAAATATPAAVQDASS